MKKLVVIFLIAGFFKISHAQSLVGRWQEKTFKVSAGYLGNYQFSEDGTFSYNTNQYFGLGRITGLEGNYNYDAQAHVLSLTVLYIDEIVGGTPERSLESGEATDRWIIGGGQAKKTKLSKPVKAKIKVEFVKSENSDNELALFDKMKYYKVE